MNRLSLSSILLPILVTPFIMTYRISPGETPYWLFAIIFGLLLAYLEIDLVFMKNNDRLKSILLWAIIVIVIGSAYYSAIVVRHQTAPVYNIHDIALQQESAVHFLLHGRNPYASTYFGTPLEEWNYSIKELNPALFHFVMMPWYLLFTLPFYAVSVSIFGFFDGRMPLVFLFFATLFLAWKLVNDNEKRRQFVALLAFNPATLGYFLEGRADFFMFAFLLLAFFLLEKEKYFFAGIPMALAFATKQSVWPIFPFYFAYLFVKKKKSLVKAVLNLLPFVITFGLIVLPFYFWNQKAFLESTLFYLSGSTPNSYPVAGYGWSMLLQQQGFIKDVHAYYPFWIWQLIACLPLGFFLLRWLIKTPAVWKLIACYGIFTFIFWYFSRYFNNSHLGYLSSVFLTTYFWQEKTSSRDR